MKKTVFFSAALLALSALASGESVVLSNKFGKVEISVFAAQIVSYVPTGGEEVFFFPEDRDFSKHVKMHGGVPVCWPWFGGNGAPHDSAHGLARYRAWKVAEVFNCADFSRARFVLESDESTRRVWPFDFRLTYTVELYSRLSLSLVTENTSDPRVQKGRWFEITQGFHPYFKVADVGRTVVKGLEGVRRDFCRPDREFEVNEGDVRFSHGMSRVYNSGFGVYRIVDAAGGREILLKAKGHKKLILFNSGVPRGPNDNMGPEDYRKYVCVEPAVIGRECAVRVLPGKRTELQMTLSVLPLEKNK